MCAATWLLEALISVRYVHPMAARHGYDDFDDLPSHASSSETSFNSAASSAGSGDARPCFVVDALERRIRIVGCDEQKRRSEQLYLLEELSPELYADYGREVEVPDEDADNYTGMQAPHPLPN